MYVDVVPALSIGRARQVRLPAEHVSLTKATLLDSTFLEYLPRCVR